MVPLNQGQLFAARAMIQAVKVTGQAIATCLRLSIVSAAV